ncbi:PD40 domain-containing protein, partial [bacterium]|nr:PD40 domain-containing protein [bacterium]
MKKNFVMILSLLLILGIWVHASAQVNARLFRYPDVSETHICFVYADDIWIVPKTGGTAHNLSSPQGEESFPRFSPDGERIAFTGNYDGNKDIYVIPSQGGVPHRVTYHGQTDRMLDWYPQGNHLLFASSRKSGRQRFNQFYRVSSKGSLPQKLPLPYAEFGMLSSDAQVLYYIPISRDFRTWKRYRGGMAPDIWRFDLETYESKRITQDPANDTQPMVKNGKLYFLSDRGPHKRYNIWVYNPQSGEFRQLTHFKEFDIHFPAIGPQDIVFEAGGEMYLFNLQSEELERVSIQVVTDRSTMKPQRVSVSKHIRHGDISPHGERVLLEARGEIFSLPSEHGAVVNRTQSSGTAERYPTYSPDGKHVAFWSDRSGEYQLVLQSTQDPQESQTLTSFSSGFRYRSYWSPDSTKLAFIDKAMTIYIYDIEEEKLEKVDQGLWMTQGALERFSASWSPDSRWLAYSRGLDNRHDAVFLYDTNKDKRYQLTSGYYIDSQPVFDTQGKYLYFFTSRTFRPIYSDVDNSFIYPNTTNIAAVPLTPDIESPLAPRNDTVEAKTEEKGEEEKEEKETPEPVQINIQNFEKRVVVLPPKAGNYRQLSSAKGKIIYTQRPRTGSAEKKSQLKYFDLEEREEKTILGDVDGYRISSDRKKLLAWKKNTYAVVEVKPKQKLDKPLNIKEMEMDLNPPKEWQQIFDEAWRLCRDYFYDPHMHGVDWEAMKEHYQALLDDAVTRSDVNFVIGELIAELNSSHTYRGGGDIERGPRKKVGYLGI